MYVVNKMLKKLDMAIFWGQISQKVDFRFLPNWVCRLTSNSFLVRYTFIFRVKSILVINKSPKIAFLRFLLSRLLFITERKY